MSGDPFKGAPRHIGAVHSPMLADPAWIIGFRWMAGELLKAGRAATRHGSMPSYSTMLIETKWKPFLKGFAAHLWKVVQDGRNGPGFRVCVLNGDIVEAYELACAVLDESITVDGQKITLPSHPSENMLAALEDIAQMLSRWQAPLNEPEAASPPPPREDEKPTATPASGSKAPQDRDRQIADLLKANGTITSLEIARRVKTSESTVRRSAPWKERQARKANHRRAKTIRKQALTRGVLVSKAGGDEDPSELAAEREVMEQHYLADVDPETLDDGEARYLDQASHEELLDYRQMSPAEQKHTVKTWLLYNV
jgi:hypothetical protein